MRYSRIVGTGSYLPKHVVLNSDFEGLVDTSDEWIYTRTGIRSRHVVSSTETTSNMALQASEAAIESAGIDRNDIDLVIVATCTPEIVFPSTASILQHKLGNNHGAVFDINAACSGFVYALTVADKLVSSGAHRCALVVGADIYSRLLDWQDRKTSVLFGDGAGAVILKPSAEPGILFSYLESDPTQNNILQAHGHVKHGRLFPHAFLEMDGPAVFKLAVRVLSESCEKALTSQGFTTQDLDWFIPHQANIRILQATAQKLGFPVERMVSTLMHQGNTSAASVPLALDAAVRDGRIKNGELSLLAAVGAGMTWGSILMRM